MKSIRTGDQNLVKKINKSIVFQAIKNKGPISRAQVSKEMKLNKATVSTMVSELLNESLINEIGEGQSSGGRKPVMLYFNNNAGYSIGIDIGVNYILGILTDLSGSIIEQTMTSMHSIHDQDIVNEMDSLIQMLIQKAPESTYGVVGIGIGFPGQIDQNDQILFAPNLKWEHINLKKHVEDRFHIPVRIENEANAGSHGEHLYGAGQNFSNIVYISIGIGIGTGIIIQNQLYKGGAGISGEMGHFTIDSNGRKCSCGNRGCWELYASESTLLNKAKEQGIEGVSGDDALEALFEEAKKGNPNVLKLLNSLAENIGAGIVNIINTFNPEAVIIGNRIAPFSTWIYNPIERVLEERLSNNHKKSTELRFSILGNLSTALGANSFAITQFLATKHMEEGI
ncbi:ROK family protein [Virgibacillus sp. NKC19-16]|uniref:ROK family transcriptional regulator n=1 Tax=Virgibacillus salidurans TaxID=2831673 RepID=UPI001F38218A|nr:ROK family transcriptional regulator [Virgibacillus sp. NKC19-16]UJL45765.1 ROK family protein [Virgibacillus sp. NKC19-16]